MKKIAFILMLLGAMLLCGCGSSEDDSSGEETARQEKVTTQYDI